MKIGIFYYISDLEIFFRQNDLKRFSTLCPKAYFGIFAVHRLFNVSKSKIKIINFKDSKKPRETSFKTPERPKHCILLNIL